MDTQNRKRKPQPQPRRKETTQFFTAGSTPSVENRIITPGKYSTGSSITTIAYFFIQPIIQ